MAKNKANKQNVVSRVREAILSTVTQMGYLLWDVELVKEGSELDLVVSIDSPRGIGLEDCEAVTHAINPILDALDPIEENYYLEVSSVGVERTLKTPEQFAFCRSWPVTVGFYAPLPESFGPLAGVKLLEGTLGELEGATLTLQCTNGDAVGLPMELVSRVKTKFVEI